MSAWCPAPALPSFGHDVTCVDKDAAKIAALQRGGMPIFEPGLAELVAEQRRAQAACPSPPTLPTAAKAADAVFIAVGTPSRRGDGLADLSYVYQAAREIAAAARRLHRDRHQVDRAGRHRRRGRAHRRASCGRTPTFAVVSNPEFLREGAAIEDFKQPDRVVVGTEDAARADVMARALPPALAQQHADRVHGAGAAPS